ncbi:hypothetical protein U2I54_21730 [Bacillus pseudomycoides]|uniref:Uncharacterized protein n=1 Tax=Bacillus bingmayongensis TaxID=1150157 RepID=A0ABU5K1P8_9BACI|nr:hypothetical protein [Bacillus pseudomycoides]
MNDTVNIEESFCSSSSYLIMFAVQVNVTTLGNWKKDKTSFTVFKLEVISNDIASIRVLFILEEEDIYG